MTVGRKRRHDTHLPQRVYLRRGKYYFVNLDGKWLPLGSTPTEMYRTLAELEAGAKIGTVGDIIHRYLREITPSKAKATREKDHAYAARLIPVFGAELPGKVRPADIARYLDQRTAKVAANREKAFLSHVFTKGMRWGVVDRNPCKGVERNTERPRDRYPTHDEVNAVAKHASDWLQRFMLLAYLTGQRPTDVRLMTRQQITPDGLYVRQGKTKKKLLLEWTPTLRSAVNDALLHAGDMLLFQHHGKPYAQGGLSSAWKRAMRKAIEAGDLVEPFQIRDLRPKAISDGGDKGIAGHASKETTRRVYIRTAQKVKPTM